MIRIEISRDTADVIREITSELQEANGLKEAELRLKYGDDAYYDMINKMFQEKLDYIRKGGE